MPIGAADLTDDLALALHLADAADAVTLASFRSLDLRVETKPDLTPVTEADQGTERTLRALLAEHRPQDSVVGEEYGGALQPGRQWVIDPIDSTRNYVRGVPVWGTLIALVEDDTVLVGVVSAPMLARRWWAQRGSGAWLKALGEAPYRLQASRMRSMADASISFSDAQGWGNRRSGLNRLLESTLRQRGLGDFWSHCLVAEGAVDIAAEPELSIWDVAALIPIIEEAGGRITALDGSDALTGGSAVTTNGLLHDEVLSMLNSQ